jgi:hypothetical protein
MVVKATESWSSGGLHALEGSDYFLLINPRALCTVPACIIPSRNYLCIGIGY